MDSVIVLFGSGVALAIMGLIVAMIAVSYHRVLKEYSGVRKTYEKALEEANKQSQEILKDAQNKAGEIIKNSEIFSKDMKTDFQSSIRKLVDYEISVYKDLEKSTNAESIKLFKSVSDSVTKNVEAYLSSVESTLSGQITDATKNIEKSMEESLDNYKKERMRAIDADVSKLVREISLKVLGRGIAIEDHEKLILKALEEAKRDNVL
ncbi:hypothetical protein C4564_05370 [Candidatus Microgenomates bacterium]|nr:MAG: hypothetical protein C4564_05370 [Candidatus Microgenomates bacterium]